MSIPKMHYTETRKKACTLWQEISACLCQAVAWQNVPSLCAISVHVLDQIINQSMSGIMLHIGGLV